MSESIILPNTELVHPVGVPFRKTVVYKAETNVKEGERAVIAAITTDALDRDREIILPRGIDRSHYVKNPVVLWAHDYRQLPIGRCMWLKLSGDGKEIIAKTQFNRTPLGDQVFKLYQDGHLNAFSIGFMVSDWYVPTEKDILDNPNLKDCRAVIKKCSLLEYSAVPVPSNPTALAREVSKGLSIPDDVKQAMDSAIEKTSINVPIDTEKWSEPPVDEHTENVKTVEEAEDLTEETVEKTVETTAAEVKTVETPVTEPKVEKTTEPQVDMEAYMSKLADAILAKVNVKTEAPVETTPEPKSNGVVEFKACDVVKSKWDAKAAMSRIKKYASEDETEDVKTIDFDVYAKAFCWFDPEVKSTSSYKLLHHDIVDGKLTVSKEAVELHLQILDSANSPIPKEFRDEVREHLKEHQKAWSDEVPPPAVPHRTLKSLEESVSKLLESMSIDQLVTKRVADIAKDRVDYHDGRI